MKKVLVLIFTMVIFSCERKILDESEPSSIINAEDILLVQNSENIPIYDGNAEILTFENQEKFSDFMKLLVKNPVSKIEENPKLRDFYSLSNFNYDVRSSKLKNLKVGTEKLIPDDEDELVYDPYFAAVLNKNREIEIEGVRFRIIKEGLVAYIDKGLNVSKVKAFVDFDLKDKSYDKAKPFQIDQEVFFYPQELFFNSEHFNETINRNARVFCTSSGSGVFGHNHECFNEYDPGDFRIKGRTWSQSFGIYASLGSKTKHQWRRFGMWLSKDANLVRRKMNIFQVEFEDPFSVQVVDFAQFGSPINYSENYNHHEVAWVEDFQTAVFTTKPPFIKKPAKARKFKKYDTEHLINKNGVIAEVQLKYN